MKFTMRDLVSSYVGGTLAARGVFVMSRFSPTPPHSLAVGLLDCNIPMLLSRHQVDMLEGSSAYTKTLSLRYCQPIPQVYDQNFFYFKQRFKGHETSTEIT